jgi:hypothetical protein
MPVYCKRKPPPLVVVHQLTNWRRLRLCLNRSFPTNDHRRRLKAAASPLIGGASKTTGFTGGRLFTISFPVSATCFLVAATRKSVVVNRSTKLGRFFNRFAPSQSVPA